MYLESSKGGIEHQKKDMWWKLILGIAALIGLALIIAVIKMAITEAKEEADDIERASGNK